MCVLDHTGTIYCWGKDNAGQLGDSGTLQRTTPIRVDGFRALIARAYEERFKVTPQIYPVRPSAGAGEIL